MHLYLFLLLLTVTYKVTWCNLIELNHDLSSDSLYWPTQPGVQPFSHTPLYNGFTKEGYWYSSYKFCSPEHVGTHLDAPSHFSERGWTVDKIPIERLFAPAVVIDVRHKIKTNLIYELSAKDVIDWVEHNGLFPNNSVVLVHTGWSNRYPDKDSYFGHATGAQKFIFPGVHPSAVQTLIGYQNASGIHIVGIGIDTPSLDYGPSRIFKAHQEVAAQNIYVLENLRNLENVPIRGAELIVMPLKIKGGSGSPCRVIVRPMNFSNGVTKTEFSKTLFGLVILFALYIALCTCH